MLFAGDIHLQSLLDSHEEEKQNLATLTSGLAVLISCRSRNVKERRRRRKKEPFKIDVFFSPIDMTKVTVNSQYVKEIFIIIFFVF